MARDPNELTIGELRFCTAYAKSGSVEQAFETAYGYSRRTIGYENSDKVMRRPRVQLKIMEIKAELSAKLEVSREAVVGELAALAFAPDISAYLDYDEDTVRIRPLSELTPKEAKAVKSVTVLPNGGIKLELYDKLAAMGQLCKVLGLASGDVNVSLNQYVVRAPAALQGAQEWEAEAARVLEADEAEAVVRLLPSPDTERDGNK
jgi:hypothetical protein